MAQLAHLSLDTGHLAMIARPPRASIDLGRTMLDAAFAGDGTAPLPEDYAGYSLQVERFGSALLASVRHQAGTAPPDAIAAFGVAPRARGGGRAVWEHMVEHAARFVASPAPAMPPTPWLASVMLPGLLARPEAAQWLAALEQAVAWGLLEGVQ